MVNWPRGSTVCEMSQTATSVWGTIPYSSIGLLPNVPTMEHVTRGARLSSNGSSSSGRCGVGYDFGTSDPQEPQEPVNFGAAFVDISTLPASDPRRILSSWEDEG